LHNKWLAGTLLFQPINKLGQVLNIVHTALYDVREATIYKTYRECHISYTINEKK